jgi:hypothetical protein
MNKTKSSKLLLMVLLASALVSLFAASAYATVTVPSSFYFGYIDRSDFFNFADTVTVEYYYRVGDNWYFENLTCNGVTTNTTAVSVMDCNMTVTQLNLNGVIQFNVTGSGSQSFLTSKLPIIVTIDGASHIIGDGWTYISNWVNLTIVTSNALIDFTPTPTPTLTPTPTPTPTPSPTPTPNPVPTLAPLPTLPPIVGTSLLNLNPLSQYFSAGNFLGFFQACYLFAFGGNIEILAVTIAMLFLVPLYIRTKSLTLICIIWVLVGGFLIVAMPIISGVSILFMALGVGGLLYKLVHSD